MKLWANTEIGGVIKIYTFEADDPTRWNRRDVISLWDYETGKCLAGTLGELDKV